MDWSYAGYRSSEMPLPDRLPTVTITDFGAVADDAADDTDALLAALEAVADGGVVEVPAGTFVLSERLRLPSGVVLQGAGSGLTTLEIPVSLTEAYGNTGLEGGGTSSYAFGGAFIEVRGEVDTEPLTSIVAVAARGTSTIEVASADELRVGQWIRVTQTDVQGALMDRLHADLLEGGEDNVGDRGTNFHSRIASIEGTSVELERALPVDLELQWSPDIRPVIASHQEIGIEGLRIEFPLTTYPGHFAEQGYNAVDISEAMHSWVRDVEVVNADYGINIRRSTFITVQNVVLSTTGDRGDEGDGHHGLNNGYGGDNLFIDFDVRLQMVHDLTNEWYATGVVFTRGRGDDLRMDHHRAAPYTTLWTELDCGAGEEPFRSGGSGNRGPHTAAYDTLWNVTARQDMAFPEDDYGPRMNFVGFRTGATETTSPYDWWFESVAPDELEPSNLWEAMVERRLPDESGTTGTSTGGDTSGDSGATGDPSVGEGDEGGSTSGTRGGTTGTSGGGSATSETTGEGEAAGDGESSGCGCQSGASGGALWLLLGFLRRRRNR